MNTPPSVGRLSVPSCRASDFGVRQTWAHYQTSLGLGFLCCKPNIIIVPTPSALGEDKMKQETVGPKLSLSLADGHRATKVAVFMTAVDGNNHSFMTHVLSRCALGSCWQGTWHAGLGGFARAPPFPQASPRLRPQGIQEGVSARGPGKPLDSMTSQIPFSPRL